MNHAQIKDKLAFFYDPEMPIAERSEIEFHLKSCLECQASIKQFDSARSVFRGAKPSLNPEWFIGSVMRQIRALEAENAAQKPSILPDWLAPLLGYGFALFLMFFVITHKDTAVSAESVLLLDVPQSSSWAFLESNPGINELFEIPQEDL